MAPEVAEGKAHGKAVDIFALGAVAYECMTSTTPYSGCNTRRMYKDKILSH